MGIDFKTFASVVKHITDARYPVMIRGKHGMGKSETVYQFAASVGLPVVERRASQMTEGDLVGLPVIEGNRTAWNPPDWFKEACERPVVLFLDEVDAYDSDVDGEGVWVVLFLRKFWVVVLHMVRSALAGKQRAQTRFRRSGIFDDHCDVCILDGAK